MSCVHIFVPSIALQVWVGEVVCVSTITDEEDPYAEEGTYSECG